LGNFQFVEYKLNDHFDRFAFYEEFGAGATFPQVMINGQKMGGCTETVKYLREHNMV
jgi:glutaredoxin